MPANSPFTNVSDLVVSLTVKVDGSPIKDIYQVTSVNVAHELYRISYADIVLAGDGLENNAHPITDSADLNPGKKIEIFAGVGGVNAVSIFKGVIVKHGIRVDDDGFSVLLTCKHEAIKMTFNRMEAEFPKQTDSAIISAIMGNYGMSCTVDATETIQENLFQKLATDWDFILARAEFLGYIVSLDNDAIFIGKPDMSAPAKLRVAMGESILNFNAEINAENQWPSIETSCWDIKNQVLLKESSSEPSVNEQGNLNSKSMSGELNQKKLTLNSSAPMLQSELKSWADAYLMRMRLSGIKGQVTFFGSGTVKTGDIIELEGVGQKFNGSAFVSAVDHSIEQGEWKTKVRFGLDAKYLNEKSGFSYSPAMGHLPGIQGLHVAIVKKIFEDPDTQYRILVTIPSNSETQNGFWARMGTFYATSDSGAFFLPEVNDEVIIGFIENDPRYPVILGSLYSNTRKTPQACGDNNNYIKSITTKSKMKISFDEENKIIKIETPGGNMISFDDKEKGIEITDQNNNNIKMNSSGITIKSDKDININGANINLRSTAKISLAAQADAEIKGLNVNLTAQIALVAKGTASAELSASGQVAVKGAMVIIN